MDKVILLLAGVAIGVALIFFLSHREPELLPPVPVKPEILVEGAESETLKLFALSTDLTDAAGATIQHLSIVYPNAASNLRLHPLPSEIDVVAKEVLPRLIVIDPESSKLYAILEKPGPNLSRSIQPRVFATSPDGAVLSILAEPAQTLLSSAVQVQLHPVTEYPDAVWVEDLSPSLELLNLSKER